MSKRTSAAARLAATAAVALAALPATAGAAWGPRESVAGGGISRIYVAPGGPAYLTGFGVPGPDRYRFAVRPWEGPLGAPLELPTDSGQGGDTVNFNFDASGNAIISNEGGRHVAYRSADGATSSETLNLDANNKPKFVSVAPTGEAMLGFQGLGTGGGAIKVAFRPAGIAATVDQVHAETFSLHGALIGLQLQADGGAIVVWQEGDVLKQSVRLHGQSSFGTPTVINSPGPDPRKFVPIFDGDPSGWAMLSWYGSSATGPFKSDQALATVRAPDGSFPDATLVGSGLTATVEPAITSAGNGIATFSHIYADGPCPSSTIMGAIYQNGAWVAATPLGPSSWPDVTGPTGGDVESSAGTHIAIPIAKIHSETPCQSSSWARTLVVRHFRGTASGLVDEGTSELAPAEHKLPPDPPTPLQQYVNDFTIEPGGKILAYYVVGSSFYLRAFGVPPAPVGPTPTPPTPPTPPIRPIVPKNFVTIIPIDPATLTLAFNCTVDDVTSGDCNLRALVYYGLTGKLPNKPVVVGAASVRRVTVGTASATLKPGQHKKVKLKLTKDGRRVLYFNRRLKVTLVLTVTRNGRSATQTFKTTIKAPKRKHH